ncbi:hypothetical protein V8F20_007844 [Naviculisporaceae sp. PSN 640]
MAPSSALRISIELLFFMSFSGDFSTLRGHYRGGGVLQRFLKELVGVQGYTYILIIEMCIFVNHSNVSIPRAYNRLFVFFCVYGLFSKLMGVVRWTGGKIKCGACPALGGGIYPERVFPFS